MPLPTAPRALAGPALGLAGATAGFVLGGVDGAALWFVVGYFLGKAIESLVLTAAGRPAR